MTPVTYKGSKIAFERVGDGKVKVYVDSMLQLTCHERFAEEAFRLVKQRVDFRTDSNPNKELKWTKI